MGKKVAHHSKQIQGAKAKKNKKKHKARCRSTSQGSEGTELSIEQHTQPMQGHPGLQEQHPEATSSGVQLVADQQQSTTMQDTIHTAGLNQEVADAVNRLIAQNLDMSITAAAQALCNLNIQVALHILDNIAITAPADINTWLRDRATAASTHIQQDVAAAPDLDTRELAIQRPQPMQLSSFQISKQIVSFGRYPDARPRGLLTDAEGRISLHSLMATWGTPQGLNTAQVQAVLQQHALSRKGQRFTTTAIHNDTMITVSQHSTPHNATRSTRPIGAPSSPKRRRHR